jgi:hypothetical protein
MIQRSNLSIARLPVAEVTNGSVHFTFRSYAWVEFVSTKVVWTRSGALQPPLCHLLNCHPGGQGPAVRDSILQPH